MYEGRELTYTTNKRPFKDVIKVRVTVTGLED